MRIRSLLIMICMSYLLCGCATKKMEYQEINAGMPNLHNSMVAFFETGDNGYVKGEHFQAKFLSCVKVKWEAIDTDYTFFRYQIVIAPIYNEPIQIKKIELSYNSEELVDYYTNHKVEGRNSFFDTPWVGELSPEQYNKWNDETEMLANQFDFTVSNMGDDNQLKVGIPSDIFDKEMTELVLTIHYNKTSETIILKYAGEVPYVTSVDDHIAIEREDISSIIQDGISESGMYPFELNN